MSKINQKNEGKGGIVTVIAIGVVIIIALLAVIIYLLINEDNGSSTTNSGADRTVIEDSRSVLITKDNVDNLDELLPKPVNKPLSFREEMNHTWTFSDGGAISTDGYVTNYVDNEYAFYFDVVRNDNKEVIYSSPIIPAGSTLDGIKLDKTLDKGSYNCMMQCHMVEKDNVTEYTTINMILTIIVEN